MTDCYTYMTAPQYKPGAIVAGMNLLFASEGWPRQRALKKIITESPFDSSKNEATSSYVEGRNEFSAAATRRKVATQRRIEAAQADRELCKELRAEPVKEAIQRPIEPLPAGSLPCGVYSIVGFHSLEDTSHPGAWRAFVSPPQPSAESERNRKDDCSGVSGVPPQGQD